MKVVFFGTPQFASRILEFLIAKKVQIAAVITKPDRPRGRSGTPQPEAVKLAAIKHGLPLYQPEIVSAPDFSPTLAGFQADLFVVVAYGEILKQHVLDMPKLGCINVHASLLPKYRGAAPIQRCIINGELETGVSVMHMVKKMDAGDVIRASRVSIGPDMTSGELHDQLCESGCLSLLEVIHDFQNGIFHRMPQNHEEATFAPKVEAEDCEIKWDQPALFIHNLVRGVNPAPGAWCNAIVRGQSLRLKINRTKIDRELSGKPGEILQYNEDGVTVACGIGSLQILELQLEGKKKMQANEMIRGIPRSEFQLRPPLSNN